MGKIIRLIFSELENTGENSQVPLSPQESETPTPATVLTYSDMLTIHKGDTQKKRRAGKWDIFTIPIIVPSDYAQQPYDQQTKDWYIFFRYRRGKGEKMTPVFKRGDLNSYRGRAKVKRAEQLRKAFEMELGNGLNPFAKVKVDEIPDNEFGYIKAKSLPEALEIIFKMEEPGWSKKTISTYKSSRKIFETFLQSKDWHKRTVADFNKSMAKSYSDWLLPKYDLTTHNNHIAMAGTFFGYMVEREILEINPFARIKKKRDGAGGHLPFNASQIKTIKDYCSKSYPTALLFTEFTLETLMRSAELRKLRISDIDFDKGIIEIVNNKRSGRTTKDKQTRRIEISKPLLQKMKKHCAGNPKEFLVFGKGFLPCGHNGWKTDISKEYTEILRGLGFGPAFTLYSLRHTGTASKAGEGVSIYKLMQILGHSSIDVTEVYLRGLGMYL